MPVIWPFMAVGVFQDCDRFYFGVIMIFYTQIFFLLVEIRYAHSTERPAHFRDYVPFALSSHTYHFLS